MMSVRSWYLEIFPALYSAQMPTLMPATGRMSGTPASMSASVPPHTVAIEAGNISWGASTNSLESRRNIAEILGPLKPAFREYSAAFLGLPVHHSLMGRGSESEPPP